MAREFLAGQLVRVCPWRSSGFVMALGASLTGLDSSTEALAAS